MTSRLPRSAAVLLLASLLPLAACGEGGSGGSDPVASSAAASDSGEPFRLYTHCGIDELHYQGDWYERVGGRLDDGQHNPPAGWDNPEQRGTISRVDESTVVFTDEAGHREQFTLREGATEPKRVCS